MNTSSAGLELIKQFEGCRLTTYLDVAGLPTIGVGHLIRPVEDFSAGQPQPVEAMLHPLP